MGRFILDLTDEQRAKLEAYRSANGLRSLAEAVRHLIDRSDGVSLFNALATNVPREDITDAALKRAAAHGDPNAARFLTGPTADELDATITSLPAGPTNWDGSPVERKPYQKGGKK